MKAIKDFAAAFYVLCDAKPETDWKCSMEISKRRAFYPAKTRKNSGFAQSTLGIFCMTQ
jgi:hypothetical protein